MKQSFRYVVLNNLRNGPWTALIACAKFLPETWKKPIDSVNKGGYAEGEARTRNPWITRWV